MSSKKIQRVIVKYCINQASSSELDELYLWVKEKENKAEFINYVKTNYLIDYNLKSFNSGRTEHELNKLIESEKRVVRLRHVQRMSKYAAAIIIGVLTTVYFLKDNIFHSSGDDTINPELVNTHVIEPGTDKATLTLEDGSQIALQKGTSLKTFYATSDGEQLVYESNQKRTKELVYNYLTVPRGGQFFIVLADGTKVWLNSESQLKYPVSFIEEQDRQVELVYGEAYFDVTPSEEHNGSKFKVLNNAQEVQVMGTEFNIKAYKDDISIYTTLVEGRVSIHSSGQNRVLKPGEQAILNSSNNEMSVALVNVNNEILWKNGIFSFDKKPLRDIMKTISRWYDVDVIYENKQLETITFSGVLGKNQNIEGIFTTLKTLSTIKNYEISNKTITLK
ncbi:FecR family protein [Aestuariivivens sediminis]|uniref:FecR family protein n=1 Tax=Aestuariivivens sediminis TaxID=2913557 RepID=UPI001F5AD9B2|nr:FecR family protein [Aestuariivivens sediminis]